MKRILFMLSAAAALLASCAKQNVSEPQIQDQDIKISFEVASRPDFESDTKAVKSDWFVGDEILIVFEGKDGWLDFSENANTLKLKKTAADWNTDKSKLPALTALASGKRFFAFHHPQDYEMMIGDLIDYTDHKCADVSSYYDIYNERLYVEYMHASGTYELVGNEIMLGFLNMQRPATAFQISVKDLCKEPIDYNWHMALLDDKGGFIYYTNYTQIKLQYKVSKGTEGDIMIEPRERLLTAGGSNIDGDRVFGFTGRNADDIVKYIRITFGSTCYYYEITPKKLSDFSGKAWLLPAVNMIDKEGALKPESKWKVGEPPKTTP